MADKVFLLREVILKNRIGSDTMTRLSVKMVSIHAPVRGGDCYCFATTREEGKRRLKSWYSWAIRCRIDQVKKVVKTVKNHWNGILSLFDSKLSNGFIEAVNGLDQSAKRKARGYRTTKNLINIAFLIAGKLDFALPT